MTESIPIEMLIAKVEKIWRKANDPGCTEAEREVFEAKALSLMERHRITEAMIDLGFEDILEDRMLIKLSGRNARIRINLIDAIADAYDSRLYWRGYGTDYTVMIFGFKSDFDRIQALSTLLLNDSLTGAAKLQGYNASNTLALRRGFVQGYTSSIARRLGEAKLAAVAEERRNVALRDLFGDEGLDDDIDWSEYEDEIAAYAAQDTTVAGAALVLVEKAARVQGEFSKRKLRSAASTTAGSYTGYGQGKDAGNRASLTSNRNLSSQKALT